MFNAFRHLLPERYPAREHIALASTPILIAIVLLVLDRYGIATLFSLAHLMYWSWIVAVMTFAGGLLFTWAYRKRGSFFYAVLLHAIAGNIIFAAGLGIYFYSGNVQRPF